jgi:hypothetical protein
MEAVLYVQLKICTYVETEELDGRSGHKYAAELRTSCPGCNVVGTFTLKF